MLCTKINKANAQVSYWKCFVLEYVILIKRKGRLNSGIVSELELEETAEHHTMDEGPDTPRPAEGAWL